MSLCIKVDGLVKSYKEHVVIDGLSISVDEGEVVVFQGPSGVGKSTFLRCLTYLEPFQSGKVTVGDLELRAGMDLKKDYPTIQLVRERLGFVFQFFNLFPHLTVLQNLTLGPAEVLKLPPERARAEALALLRRVGLEPKADAFPSSLSGGQQQRVAIARALAMHPRAVLFDEPTSSLDPAMKHEIIDVMEDFSHDGLTMLIVTHEPAFVEKIATRVVELGPHGKIRSDQRRSARRSR